MTEDRSPSRAGFDQASIGSSTNVSAALDLGSNSVHLLVAGVAEHRLESLVDESVFLGLGVAVDARGYLGAEARARLVESLVHYTELARGLGARAITFLGTEPIRRAADGPTIVHEVERATGVPIHVLSHEEEAFLTVVGVMAGRVVERETLIVDVGGGSSEFCVIGPTDPPRASGLKLGSNRLTTRLATGDPPTRVEVAAMTAEAETILRDAPHTTPAEVVAVGGTASNLLKVVPGAQIDLVLTRARIAEALDILANETAEEAVVRHLVKPIRARLLPAGAAIMDALLTRYDVSRIRVSDAGIREGAILVVDHVGGSWRDRLPELAHGWRD